MANKIKKYPKILIVGRTNVGKSTLFNRLSKDTQSIVLEQEGVTRDYVHEIITWNNKNFDLIDTGGVSFKKQTNPILEQVRQQVFDLFKETSLILFVCDVKNGITLEDQEIAKILHKTKKSVFLLLNKCDNTKAYEQNSPDFYALGFKNIFGISSVHGTGIVDLLDGIMKSIENIQITEIEAEKPAYKVAILGKPNVGKSSLMNLLIKQERSIVSQIPGTTREAISENIYTSEDIIQITDTAGLRKKSKISDELETLMAKSSLSAIRTSDIILLIIDSSEQQLADQELKLLFYAYEQKKAIILLFNKTDLLSEYDRKTFEHTLKKHDFILKKIPLIWISCKNKKNISKIYTEIEKLSKRLKQKFNDLELNETVKNYWLKKPMYHKTIQLKLFKIRSIEGKIPTFVLHVNHPEWFEETQLGFIENLLRKNYDLKGCAIQFYLKKV